MAGQKLNLLLMSGLIWIVTIISSRGENQYAIGGLRSFPRTSFTCTDRPAGYYADIETGCQVYHMCDGLGRQFSYSCPNTTLFQQRMLICDHWYMVNCSKAEMDYTANLLIGQRDKPFVPEEENHLRTPRPDLLDRPYAPDYSGESFRNQYKILPSIQNRIVDLDEKKNTDKPSSTPTRWKLPQPSQEIFPPSLVKDVPLATTAAPLSHLTTVTSTTKKLTDTTDDNTDLRTAHSTRYNTSGDNLTVDRQAKPLTKDASTKEPSRIYEPPFLYPIYNQNDSQSTEITLKSSTAAPFTAASPLTTVSGTTVRSTKPTAVPGQPFSQSPIKSSSEPKSTHLSDPSLDYKIPAKDANKLPVPSPFEVKKDKSIQKDLPSPAKDLLPPFEEEVIHDTATTQGPPIYYEWKIPSDGLEPPKLDPPIGVDGREEEPYTPDQLNSATTITTKSTGQYNSNPFLSNKTQRSVDSSTAKAPTSRSIKEHASHGSANQINPTLPSEYDIQQLRKDFSIPDYSFPLEDVGRTGYEHDNTFNSFQIKIPHHWNEDEAAHWYGENPECPECHPSFLQPGSCEPCVRR